MQRFNDPIEEIVRGFTDGLVGEGGKSSLWGFVKGVLGLVVVGAVLFSLGSTLIAKLSN